MLPIALVLALETPPVAPPSAQPAPHAQAHLLAEYNDRGYFPLQLQPFDPVYFLGGPDPLHAKFQVSLRHQLFDAEGSWAETPLIGPVIGGLAIAYTQVSLWDLSAPSKPFYDTSYKPELHWYRHHLLGDDSVRMSLRLGLQHESNGKGEGESRSLNDLYAQSTLTWNFADRRIFRLVPRVWSYLGDLSDNPQIKETRGWWSCQAVFGWHDDFQAAVDLRPGQGGAYPLVTADLTWPLHRATGGNFPIFLHVQGVVGYGETLRDYDRFDSAIRIGISLVR